MVVICLLVLPEEALSTEVAPGVRSGADGGDEVEAGLAAAAALLAGVGGCGGGQFLVHSVLFLPVGIVYPRKAKERRMT